ncbi:arylsulfatase A-like enzyme [Dysgonomonas hofstadii]|uniref:Arylsulfatase A-like enzyme n=1 Tax=Dysgonomonas hofstadii TaxID=637886 RepID=A0A840CNQ2_9BACT|nr:sulfatase [Dysgonomonas hofstadii]MBB4034192.1 arylsulfatase A-like enzyme [Dysgonomonas hofstadii]
MKKTLITATTFVTLSSGLFAQTNKHPNVIYIFPDQFRNSAMQFWDEKGFCEYVNFKADPVHTPTLNNFAKESVVLTSAQSICPLSSPYRGMFLTGMYPGNSGVPLNCNSSRPISNLRKDAVTISDVFGLNGYQCAYVGKLHAEYPTRNNPQAPGTYVESQNPVWDAYTAPENRHGFDFWYSYGTYDVHKSPHYWDTEGNRHEIKEWSPEHEADKIIEYLTTKRDENKPFFLVWSANPPHSPYRSLNDCKEEDYNLYKDIPLEHLLVRPNVNKDLKEKQACAPYYFASVTGVDREFGRVLQTLKSLGLDENTIVVFTSDHGETMASHVLDPKNSPYSESMNVPFIIRYPKVLKPKVSPLLLSPVDIMPTLLSLAGLKNEIPVSVQGKDLSGFFQDKTSAKDALESVLYIRNIDGETDNDGNVVSYFPVARGIKTSRYTLAITIDRDNSVQDILFFDDKNDPYQMNNLSIEAHRKEFYVLCNSMSSLLKNADDPWYRNKILSDIIPYDK